MSFELRPARLGSTALIGGNMARRLIQPSNAPLLSQEALDIVRARVAPVVEASASSSGNSDVCACMLNAIPGIAESEENMQAGMALCVQDPTAFAQQVAQAGWTTHCGAELAAQSGANPLTSVGRFLASTEGKIVVGGGVLAVLGLGAWLVLH